MCLYIHTFYHPRVGKGNRYLRALIAGYDIQCCKALEYPDVEGGLSPYRSARWNFGELKEQKMIPNMSRARVNAGLHAFVSKKESHFLRDNFPAIIPAGTRFYLGINGDIVAEAMIVYRNQQNRAVGRKLIKANFKKHVLEKIP